MYTAGDLAAAMIDGVAIGVLIDYFLATVYSKKDFIDRKEVRKQIEKSFQKQADKVVVNRPAPQGNPPTNRISTLVNQNKKGKKL